jgi:hypothetical protein
VRASWSTLPRIVLLALGSITLTGCYTYRATQAPAPGSMIRVSVPLSSALDGGNASPRYEAVEGRLLSTGDTLALAVETRRMLGAHRELTQIDTLRVAAARASAVEIREFSTGRSIALGTAVAAVATGAAAVAFGWGGGSSGDRTDGGGPVTSIVASQSLISSLWGLVVR